MSDVRWIKITTDIFDDEKIQLIESMPEGDTLIVIWFKLLVLAGKQNYSGVLALGDKVFYTEDMLTTVFRRKSTTVKLALTTFEQWALNHFYGLGSAGLAPNPIFRTGIFCQKTTLRVTCRIPSTSQKKSCSEPTRHQSRLEPWTSMIFQKDHSR